MMLGSRFEDADASNEGVLKAMRYDDFDASNEGVLKVVALPSQSAFPTMGTRWSAFQTVSKPSPVSGVQHNFKFLHEAFNRTKPKLDRQYSAGNEWSSKY